MNRINPKIKRIISAFCIVILIFSAAACGRTREITADAEDVVFRFAGSDVSLGEVYIYAQAVKEDYESVYGTDIWGTDVSVTRDDTANMEDVTRKDIIEDIVHVKLLAMKASEYKAALTEEEMQQVSSETDAFYENLTDEQILEMRLTYEQIKGIMEENAIARKVYDTIIEDANIEISDEEARETTFYDLYFECYTVASSGDVTKFAEDERQSQYERALQAYNTLINPIDSGNGAGGGKATNIEGLAEYYGLHNASYYTMTPSEIAGIYGEDIADSLYNLEDESYSLVTESEYGYHIFYMKALTDREATDKRKQELIGSKRRGYMDTTYKNWLTSVDPDFSYEKSVDFNVYNSIKFN